MAIFSPSTDPDKQAFATEALRHEWLDKADILIEALPFMRQYADQTVVIKYGGNAMGDEETARHFARDAVLLKQVGIHPVVVHGGGPQIGAVLKELSIQSHFVDGLRVTGEREIDVVEMVLAGRVNKSIVAAIHQVGGRAIGLSGKDGGLIRARKLTRMRKDPDSNIERVVDLGFVGEPDRIDPTIIEALKGTDFIPIIAPTGMGADGRTYNINADTVAGAVAAALKAARLFLLTDVHGVMTPDKRLIAEHRDVSGGGRARGGWRRHPRRADAAYPAAGSVHRPGGRDPYRRPRAGAAPVLSRHRNRSVGRSVPRPVCSAKKGPRIARPKSREETPKKCATPRSSAA